LEDSEGKYGDNDSMLKHAVEFYKNLFGKEPMNNIKLDQGFWGEEEKVTGEENAWLEAKFSKEEIKRAIEGSFSEGALGPDGFSFLFYQKFWLVIRTKFMALVKGFEKGEINIARSNYAMIILISKEEEATTLKKFRPISLINCSLKVFSKAMNNRLESISDRLLGPNQTTFIKGRYILESVVAAHEIIHETVKIRRMEWCLSLIMKKLMIVWTNNYLRRC
jgi:hypothetical protein